MRPTPTTRRRGTFLAGVLANDKLCREHHLLRLLVRDFPPTRPGQFIQLQCNPLRTAHPHRVPEWPEGRPPRLTQPDLLAAEALLRRPFSLAGRRDLGDGDTELRVIYRVVGAGTGWLEALPAGLRSPDGGPGPSLSILGPLGNAFPIHDDKPAAALVGGGVGIPPMLYLAEELARRGKRAIAFCGARSAELLPLKLAGRPAEQRAEPAPCIAEFAELGVPGVVATDDGSLGLRGYISGAFLEWVDKRGRPPGELAVYACGPEPMMRAVGDLCIARGIECHLALERHMACGMGTCQSCVFRMRADNEQGWAYRLVCADGPVFNARDIVWG